jgi:hypothetical protein
MFGRTGVDVGEAWWKQTRILFQTWPDRRLHVGDAMGLKTTHVDKEEDYE